jgi:hypothetical protein
MCSSSLTAASLVGRWRSGRTTLTCRTNGAVDCMRRQSVPFFILSLEEEADRGVLPVVAMHLDQRYTPLADVPVPRRVASLVERDRAAGTTDLTTDGRFARRVRIPTTRGGSAFRVVAGNLTAVLSC